MNAIELKKEEAAFYFNQARLNISGLDEIIEKQLPHIGSNRENAKKTVDMILDNPEVLKKMENYVFNSRDIAKNARGELEALLLKLVELRNFYSHYVHKDDVKTLSYGEKPLLDKYYEIAIEATGSKDVRLEIIDDKNKLTDAGVLFLLCMFLKKSEANKLISSIRGFKRNDKEGQPRRNLFTYYSVREGYKVVPDMQKHFLLFTLVNHLSNQDEYISNLRPNQEIGQGGFFHRIASKFLSDSGILHSMKFYTYRSKRLTEQRGELKPKKDHFTWIEPFQGNSYFSVQGQKGVIGEEQLKELCYVLLVAREDFRAVEGKVTQFLKKFQNANNVQQVEKDEVLEKEYFPANYFENRDVGRVKDKILNRLKKITESYKAKGREVKAYDKMKEVMEFINNCLPTDENLKLKDYRRYLKMVRFWGREKENIKREFDSKKWERFLPRELWQKRNLEDAYQLAKEKNTELFNKLKTTVERMNELEFEKYQQINDAKDLANLRQLARDFGVKWEEKDWQEYSGQIKKQITDRQKLTIMKQRITAALKKKQGIENLNLRITTDTNKSRKVVLNRIALPKGFVRKHILKTDIKISKQIRQSQCPIILSNNYMKLAKEFFEERNFDKMTQINGLFEKNVLIAFMIVYLMEQLNLRLGKNTELSNLKKTEVNFTITDKVTEKVQISQYPSLVFAINREYVDGISGYKLPPKKPKEPPYTFFEKIDAIEKERMEFIKQVLGFEEHLFEKNVIDKTRFTDTATHISFNEICDELIKKGWDENKIIKLKDARNAALHGKIPEDTSFDEAKVLINELKK